jgi:glycosyltransferase involved in cell wall biosynthesis
MIVGIDASNLNEGGGLTHLLEILANFDIDQHNIDRVVIWGRPKTLIQIRNYSWLKKISPKELNLSLFRRLVWQRYGLTKSAKVNDCDLMFSPGSIFFSNFKPYVTMSQNMLPFESKEAKRYGFSLKMLRLMLLRKIHSKAFISSEGVIFLTNYAKDRVTKVLGKKSYLSSSVISHGVNARFFTPPKEQFNDTEYSLERPFNLVYVSTLDTYKHQWHVVEAVAKLRKEGYPVVLNLFGSFYLPSKKRLEKSINKFDLNGEWVKYHGEVPYQELHNIYKKAHLGVFASSCENMPIILLEKMASGLPIACSNKGPMLEILGNSSELFNPEEPLEIYHALKKLINNKQLRADQAEFNFQSAQKYTWKKCASKTFSYLEDVFQNYKKLD